MASPPFVGSPSSALSPPYPSPAQIPSKKRTSTLDTNTPPGKRRKPSNFSQSAGPTHPLRQASFPTEARSPYARSPSVDAASHFSGSVVSATTSAAPKKKRGRKAKNAKTSEVADNASSVAGGRPTQSQSQAEKEGEEDDEDEKAEMALEDVGTRTQEQTQEEKRLRAMLVDSFDRDQYDRYEHWRAARLSDAVVKRVVNATVSQSVPQMVSTAVKAVAKIFAGEIIEAARDVQGEWVLAGEQQSDMPTPPRSSAAADHGEEEPGGTAMKTIRNVRRGPLRPDHLREACRRYKLSGESRGVGVQQLWHAQQNDGADKFSTRTGRRLFK